MDSCSKRGAKVLKVDDICKLVYKYYPEHFTYMEKEVLRIQFHHFQGEITKPEFIKLFGISELCQSLVLSRKLDIYSLVYKLIKLVLIVPVSTAITKRTFSSMNTSKTKLQNKMDDEFLDHCKLI